jgi:hypothetical protein
MEKYYRLTCRVSSDVHVEPMPQNIGIISHNVGFHE